MVNKWVLGSGFFISKDGYFVTNYHVAGNSISLIIKMIDGNTYFAKVVGIDKLHDLAILKVEGTDFEYLKFGNIDEMTERDRIYTIGSPYGYENVLSIGSFSSKNVFLADRAGVYIEHNAKIYQGSSGSPLFNNKGEVIGVNFATNDVQSFSIRTDYIEDILINKPYEIVWEPKLLKYYPNTKVYDFYTITGINLYTTRLLEDCGITYFYRYSDVSDIDGSYTKDDLRKLIFKYYADFLIKDGYTLVKDLGEEYLGIYENEDNYVTFAIAEWQKDDFYYIVGIKEK